MKDFSQYLKACVLVFVQIFIIKVLSQLYQVDFASSLAILALIQMALFKQEYLNHTHEL